MTSSWKRAKRQDAKAKKESLQRKACTQRNKTHTSEQRSVRKQVVVDDETREREEEKITFLWIIASEVFSPLETTTESKNRQTDSLFFIFEKLPTSKEYNIKTAQLCDSHQHHQPQFFCCSKNVHIKCSVYFFIHCTRSFFSTP